MLITGAAGRKQPRDWPKPHRSAGYTLLEILIAVLILSIGLLGLAGLQTVSTQYNHSAYLRTTANNLSYDIVDRMRANRQEAVGGRYDIGFGETPGIGGVAGADLNQWLDAVDAALPEGEASVDSRSDGRVRVRVRWRDSRDERDEGDEVTTYSVRTRL